MGPDAIEAGQACDSGRQAYPRAPLEKARHVPTSASLFKPSIMATLSLAYRTCTMQRWRCPSEPIGRPSKQASSQGRQRQQRRQQLTRPTSTFSAASWACTAS